MSKNIIIQIKEKFFLDNDENYLKYVSGYTGISGIKLFKIMKEEIRPTKKEFEKLEEFLKNGI